jgi:hypothetical protein
MGKSFTPGPWYADGFTVKKDIKDRAWPIAEVIDWAEETSGNAALLAAAPALYASLAEARNTLDLIHAHFSDAGEFDLANDLTQAMIEIESELAKARGES